MTPQELKASILQLAIQGKLVEQGSPAEIFDSKKTEADRAVLLTES